MVTELINEGEGTSAEYAVAVHDKGDELLVALDGRCLMFCLLVALTIGDKLLCLSVLDTWGVGMEHGDIDRPACLRGVNSQVVDGAVRGVLRPHHVAAGFFGACFDGVCDEIVSSSA